MNNWLLLPTMAISVLIGAAQPNWAPFRCRAGGFTVSMPDRPREDVKLLPSNDGPIPMHRFVDSSTGSPIAYMVTYQRVSPVAARIPVARFLDACAEAAPRDIHGRLLHCRPHSVQGFPGREIAAGSDHGVAYHSCICLAHGRLYQVIVLGAGNEAFSHDATKFLSSFRLLPKT